MAIREIVWTVADNGKTIHPTVPQDGGVQGEHNATRAVWRVGENSVWETPTFKVYVECEDNAGNVDHTEPLQVEGGQISVLLPQAWTQYGGISTLRLVAEEEDGVVAYLVEGYARFSSRQNASKKVDGLMKGRLAQMEQRANDALSGAEEAIEEALTYARSCYQYAHGAQVNAQAAVAAAAEAKNAAEEAAASAAQAQYDEKYIGDAATFVGTVRDAAVEAKSQAEVAAQQASVCAVAAKKSEEYAATAVMQCSKYVLRAENAAESAENAAGGGGITVDDVKPFRFTVTKSGKGYTSSATYEEINDVLTAGNRVVICEYEGFELPFAGYFGVLGLVFYTNAVVPSIRITFFEHGNVFVQTESEPVTVVNVLDYDAVGDGKTDDTDAIQEALYEAEKLGLPLYIPAGNYLVSKTITTHKRETDSDKQSKALTIYGAGMNTVFTTAEDFDGDYVFYIDVAPAQPCSLWVHDFDININADVSGIYFHKIGMKAVVENLWIKFDYFKKDGEAVRTGIFCEDTTVSTFQRIKIQGNLHDPLRTRNCGIVLHESYTTKVVDCDIIYCGWAVYLNSGSNNTVEHCRIDENEYGVFQNSSTIFEVENKAYASTELSFRGTLRNLTIRNNRFECNNVCSVFLAAYGTGGLNYMYNAQVTIANNDFSGLGAGTARYSGGRAVFRKAIRLYHCKGVTIKENAFSGKPYDEADTNSLSQNITGKRTEDITFRGNVATTGAAKEKNEDGEWVTITDENGFAIICKTNPIIDPDWLNYSHETNQPVSLAEQGLVDDIEVDQSTRDRWRGEIGDIDAALDELHTYAHALVNGGGAE